MGHSFPEHALKTDNQASHLRQVKKTRLLEFWSNDFVTEQVENIIKEQVQQKQESFYQSAGPEKCFSLVHV